MTITQMRQMLRVYEAGSINKAAQQLFISQSGLSASITAAEEEIGTQIFVRSASGTSLTPFGMTFIETAKEIIKIYDKMLNHPDEHSQNNSLRVSSQFLHYVNTIFGDMHREFKDSVSSFRFVIKSCGGVCHDVLNSVSEIGIIVTPKTDRERRAQLFKSNGIKQTIITEDRCRCIVGKGSPLYDTPEDSIHSDILAEFPMVTYEDTTDVWNLYFQDPDLQDIPHNGKLIISDTGSFQSVLTRTNGFFIGIFNEQAYVDTSFYENLRPLSITDMDYPYDTSWLKLKDKPLSPIAKTFLRKVYTSVGVESSEKDFE